MNGMPELLAEMADEAKTYDGVDRAVRVLRRRRRMTRLAPLGVAAVVAAGLMLTYVSVRSAPTGDQSGHDKTAQIPTSSLSWLPSTLTVPRTPPPPLPADRGVGPAALIYEQATPLVHQTTPPGADPATDYLVSVDGGQYRLPYSPVLSLSPDGRWLLSVRSERLILRDLTTSDTKDLGGYGNGTFAAAWASNTSRLAFEQSFDRATVVDLPSGQSHTVDVSKFRGTRVCGVQDSGDLILCSMVPLPNQFKVWLADGRTGEQRSYVTTDLSSALTDAERASESVNTQLGRDVRPLAGGTTLLVRTHRYAAGSGVTVPDDLLAVDLSAPHAVRRLDLPPQEAGKSVPSNGGVAFSATEGWTVLSALTDGVLLAHTGPRGTGPDAMVDTVYGLELLNPTSGTRSSLTRVSGDVSTIIVRGTVRP